METALWTWGGEYFGYREDDELWAHHGRLVGKFRGDEVYGDDGEYLGEIRDGDRLITKTASKHKRAGSFGIRQRGARGLRGLRGMRGLIGGYEDFPSPDAFQ
jgi:hypothetical protein